MRTKETYIKRCYYMSNFIAWMQWYAKEAGICTKETYIKRPDDIYVQNETEIKRHDCIYV